MISVESGPEKAGQWVMETRDVVADYKRCFGKKPPRVGAIAIMTDTDQTQSAATAWYGPIRILDKLPALQGGPPGETRAKGDGE